MAYIFIDDQSPDASEYENNYIFFDEDNLDTFQAIDRKLSIMSPCRHIDRL